ncbi:MAG: hypothetical protein LBU30_02355 [Candidatus Methanoplasma sp.]|jgi:hypothetical protein|nr:hypothetical protein [Candidatus Methanoplasma sp.]
MHLIKNGLRKDSKGIATLVILIVAVVIVAGAGATYIVLIDKDDSGKDSGDTPLPLGGPGLNAGESLTYAIKGGISGSIGGMSMDASDALSGTIAIKCSQMENDSYSLTVVLDISYDLLGQKGKIDVSESITVEVLDMSKFNTDTVDFSSLGELGYTDEDIRKIQALIDDYQSGTETMMTADGNIQVEKRIFEYGWDDFKNLIPDTGFSMDAIPIDALDVNMSLWFGKDVLYKMTFDFNLETDFEGDGKTDSLKLNTSMELIDHKKI